VKSDKLLLLGILFLSLSWSIFAQEMALEEQPSEVVLTTDTIPKDTDEITQPETEHLPLKNKVQENSVQEFQFFKDEKTRLVNPFALRDPFKRKVERTKFKRNAAGKIVFDNNYSNIVSIQDVPVSRIRVVGVFLGPERRAMVKIVAKEQSQTSAPVGGRNANRAAKSIVAQTEALSVESYIIKEGMKLGGEDAEVKAILPGGVVLVEKIRNVYDQDEYLETILPIYGN